MIDLFKDLIGNYPLDNDLMLVLASLFFLFILTVFSRFFEIFVDYLFGRKK